MIGRIVAGRFQLVAEAGSGGMGTVYRACDLASGATVAVKILTGREHREIQRFDQEASILARLAHPAIVRYLAHGVAEGGERYIAMEWLDGEDLCTRLERQPVTVAETIALARRASEALAYAHAQDIVHRDVKPENLFLPEKAIERVKVLDFGIARLTHGGRKLTLTGRVIGTPGYMAPEIVRGDRDITARADVFSLGCVMFQCLTGRPVFEAEESTALLAKILLQDAPRLRDVVPGLPRSLDDVVAGMLSKDPARRLPDARAVIAALDALPALAEAEADGGATARRGRARPALTASEQRIACVVIAGPSTTAERRWRGATVPLSVADDEGLANAQLRRLGALEDELAAGARGPAAPASRRLGACSPCPTGARRPIRRPGRRAARWRCTPCCRRCRSASRRGRGAFRPGRWWGRSSTTASGSCAGPGRATSASTTWRSGCSTRASTSGATGRCRSCAGSGTCSRPGGTCSARRPTSSGAAGRCRC